MNNIQEKDWAEDAWCGHTGMDSASDDYCCSTDNETAQNKQSTKKEPSSQENIKKEDSES